MERYIANGDILLRTKEMQKIYSILSNNIGKECLYCKVQINGKSVHLPSQTKKEETYVHKTTLDW